MSWTDRQRITVVAVVVLVATVPLLWQIDTVRSEQQIEAKQAELTEQTVETRQAPNDYDGDGIPDSTDQCPTRPETTDGFQDSDGCPDVADTTGAS